MTLLHPWNETQRSTLGKEIVTFSHNLADHSLFSDEALIDLIDRHPHHMLDVNTIGPADHPKYPNKHLTVDFRTVGGAELLEAAKSGRIFMSIRNALIVHPEYKAVRDQLFSELQTHAGLKTPNTTGTILISSPTSQTPYHFDKKEVILWHLRGQKRLYVYPPEAPFITERHFEDVVSSFDDDLPYQRDFDNQARVFDLQPGEAISWPLNAPHRVENASFCVSINTEYSTPETLMKLSNIRTNAMLRQHLGLSPSYENDPFLMRALKTVSGQILNRTVLRHHAADDPVMFEMDPASASGIREVEPFQRDF